MSQYKDELNKRVEDAKELQKLMENKSFQKFIMKSFLEDSVLALSSNLSRVQIEKRPYLIEQLIGRNVLTQFLQDIIDAGGVAKEELNSEELTNE